MGTDIVREINQPARGCHTVCQGHWISALMRWTFRPASQFPGFPPFHHCKEGGVTASRPGSWVVDAASAVASSTSATCASIWAPELGGHMWYQRRGRYPKSARGSPSGHQAPSLPQSCSSSTNLLPFDFPMWNANLWPKCPAVRRLCFSHGSQCSSRLMCAIWLPHAN